MHERLIELIGDVRGNLHKMCHQYNSEMVCDGCKYDKSDDCALDRIADYLLENGVIVPPYKRGTIVYVVRSRTSNGKNLYMKEERIDHYRVFDDMVFMCFERGEMSVADYMWKESVFLTKEEAEAALVNYESTKIEKGGKER